MATIVINPGSGPVANAEEYHAVENMKQFIVDAELPEACIRRKPAADCDGRFAFEVSLEHGNVEVLMPGIPLDEVRYMGRHQNIWDFPRLYVDGSSWVWLFAFRQLRDHFNLENPEQP